jgi:hypothetical protein
VDPEARRSRHQRRLLESVAAVAVAAAVVAAYSLATSGGGAVAGDPTPSPTPLSPAGSLGVGAQPTGVARFLSPSGLDSGDGSLAHPWATLAHAADALRPGETLYVRAGTYLGQSANWTRGGLLGQPIRVTAYPGERPVFDGNGSEQFLRIRGAAHVAFENLVVTNYHVTDDGIIDVVDGANDIRFRGLTMTGCSGPDQRSHLIYIGAAGVRDVTIEDSRLDGIPGGAIHLYHAPNATGVRIVNNVLAHSHWGVIVTSGASDVTIDHTTLVGNDVGVEIWDASNVRLRSNVFAAPSGSGLVVRDQPPVAEDHDLFDVGDAGFLVGGEPLTLQAWRASTGLGLNSIAGPARLGPDLRPLPGSPAIGLAADAGDAGADISRLPQP